MVGFPLLLIPLAIYNIIVFLMPDVSFTDPLVKVTLMSGAEWAVTLSDVLLTLAILLLLAEVIKGARPGAKYLTDHLLSLIVFGAAAAEFVLWPKFGTSTYFLLTALSLVDFLSGLALRTRRRAVAVAAAPAPPPKAADEKSRLRRPSPQPAARAGSATCACCAIGTGGSLCRRIRAAGSPRSRNRCSPPLRPRRPRRRRLHRKSRRRRSSHRRSRHRDCSRAQAFRHRRISRTRLSAESSRYPSRQENASKQKARWFAGSGSRCGHAGSGWRHRPSAHPPAKPASGRGSAAPVRQSRSAARQRLDRAAAPVSATSARTGSPAPARCRPARRG